MLARSELPPHDFLTGGGEMGARMRAHDWSSSPLGWPQTWPQSLRKTVSLILASKFPMFVAWGRELAFLYNDGYRPIFGAKHPHALGLPFRQVWSEIWSDISPLVDGALAGTATFAEDLPLVMQRHGYEEQTYFTFSYSPVHDESGGVAGVFCACTETTTAVKARAAMVAETERLRRLFHQAPGFMAVTRGPEHVFEITNAAYEQLVGGRELVGKTVREALPEVEGQGFFELLDRAFQTGEPFVGRGMPLTVQADREGAREQRFLDFVYQPITDASGQVTGIFVEGSDVTEAKRAAQHQQLLINELNHRVKNTLATVQSIVLQTLRNASSLGEARQAFERRLMALSRAHDVLTRENWEGAALREITQRAVEPYRGPDGSRVRVAGPDARLSPRTALALSMAYQELATNAVKYGALSNASGSIDIIWALDEQHEPPCLRLRWEEKGGPPVERPTRRGFGSRLIERSLADDLEGKVHIAFEPTGVVCTVSAPLG